MSHRTKHLYTRRDIALGALPCTAALILSLPASAKPREGYLHVSGGKLWHWDTGGSGPPLLLVHPATGSHESWPGQRDFFAAQGFRVIAYSRWGYAPSDPAPTPARSEQEDLGAIIDSLHLDEVSLVGVGAGVGVIAPFIAWRPHVVRRAAFIGSLLGIDDETIRIMIERIRSPGFATLPEEFRELSGSYRASSPDGVAAWLAIEHRRPRSQAPMPKRPSVTLAQLAATNVPLLLATGDADLFTPPAVMRSAALRLANARYHTIADAGHAPFWEQPEAFNKLLLQFLASK